jgi:hypothetical protein
MDADKRAWPGRVSAALFFESESAYSNTISDMIQNWPTDVLSRLDLHAVIAFITVNYQITLHDRTRLEHIQLIC